MAAHLHAPTEFRLLNAPADGKQSVACGYGDGDGEVERVERLLSTTPSGSTPLCAAIRQVTAEIRSREPSLRAAGKRAVVVIASDGAAMDGDVHAALRPLKSLPAWVVVRLCTDDDAVVQYWNRVDEDLELDMDVLDDLAGEAAEVTSLNPWLTYPLSLHRIREFGSCEKIFDLLDERELTLVEAKQFAGLLLGGAVADAPHPEVDYAGFVRSLKSVLAAEPSVWCPRRKRHAPWIRPKELRRLLKRKPLLPATMRSSGSSACSVS